MDRQKRLEQLSQEQCDLHFYEITLQVYDFYENLQQAASTSEMIEEYTDRLLEVVETNRAVVMQVSKKDQ